MPKWNMAKWQFSEKKKKMKCTVCKDTQLIVVSETPWGQTTIPCECVDRTICWECKQTPSATGFTVCKGCWNKAHPDLPIKD